MIHQHEIIGRVRSFNRFYTNILGLLDRDILDSGYSLTEARILFELGEFERVTASALAKRLTIDKSYLSRIVAGFEKKELIIKEASNDDSRAFNLRLSEKGLDVIGLLTEKSNAQISRLLAPLSRTERDEIGAAMETIQKHLARTTDKMFIRPFTDADRSFVITRQIRLYEVEYGFTSDAWKAYVTNGVNQLVSRFDSDKDCLLILEASGKASGCIAITHTDEGAAQLRFFFVEAGLRGQGAGRRLIDAAIRFCRDQKYNEVFLWTFSKLEAARHLYKQQGFILTDTHENSDWGQAVLEEKWLLKL